MHVARGLGEAEIAHGRHDHLTGSVLDESLRDLLDELGHVHRELTFFRTHDEWLRQNVGHSARSRPYTPAPTSGASPARSRASPARRYSGFEPSQTRM